MLKYAELLEKSLLLDLIIQDVCGGPGCVGSNSEDDVRRLADVDPIVFPLAAARTDGKRRKKDTGLKPPGSSGTEATEGGGVKGVRRRMPSRRRNRVPGRRTMPKTPQVSPNGIKSIDDNSSIDGSCSGIVWDEGEVGAAGFIINFWEAAHVDALKRSPKITLGSEVCLFVKSLQTTS